MKPSCFAISGAFFTFLALSGFANANELKVGYPEGYKQWPHIKSMIIEQGHPLENPFQGLHHVYGNSKALTGFEDGVFPDGSVLVFDLVQENSVGKTIQEGQRKLVGVMQKNEEAFRSTGGWGFEGFAGNSKTDRLVKDKGVGCFSCHESQRKRNYVFSEPRE